MTVPSPVSRTIVINMYPGNYPIAGGMQWCEQDIVDNQWCGINYTATVPQSYRTIRIAPSPIIGPTSMYIKNIKIVHYQKAEVQDSEMTWAGRRTSYYEGTKMTSTDINVDSADTIDGGPVITINTVNSDVPIYDPLGTSVVIVGANNTNQSQ